MLECVSAIGLAEQQCKCHAHLRRLIMPLLPLRMRRLQHQVSRILLSDRLPSCIIVSINALGVFALLDVLCGCKLIAPQPLHAE